MSNVIGIHKDSNERYIDWVSMQAFKRMANQLKDDPDEGMKERGLREKRNYQKFLSEYAKAA